MAPREESRPLYTVIIVYGGRDFFMVLQIPKKFFNNKREIEMLNKIFKTLKHEARKGSGRSPEECVEILRNIIPRCGPFSQGIKVCREIGLWLLRGNREIIVPVCPDYSHHEGKYDFRTLNGGVPLLAELHVLFLKEIVASIGSPLVTLLVADHEADDPLLCKVVGKSRAEFVSLIQSSVVELRKAVRDLGWKAEMMTTVIPTLVEQEASCAEWIRNDPSFEQRTKGDTVQRSEMYLQLNSAMKANEMLERTIRTSAQYVALGRHAKEKGMLVCNHTTTNLVWYLQAGAAVLHNPVSVY